MDTEIHQEEVPELDSADFGRGFNHASILADFAPELLKDIQPGNNMENDYFDGFFSAKEYYHQQELENARELNEVQALRNKSKEKDNELER